MAPDLSSGAVMALAGLVSAMLIQSGLPIWLAVAAGLLSGALVGFCNGALVGGFNTPPFIVTLGMMGLVRGLTFGLSGGRPVRDLPLIFCGLGQNTVWLGPLLVPVPLLMMVGRCGWPGYALRGSKWRCTRSAGCWWPAAA